MSGTRYLYVFSFGIVILIIALSALSSEELAARSLQKRESTLRQALFSGGEIVRGFSRSVLSTSSFVCSQIRATSIDALTLSRMVRTATQEGFGADRIVGLEVVLPGAAGDTLVLDHSVLGEIVVSSFSSSGALKATLMYSPATDSMTAVASRAGSAQAPAAGWAAPVVSSTASLASVEHAGWVMVDSLPTSAVRVTRSRASTAVAAVRITVTATELSALLASSYRAAVGEPSALTGFFVVDAASGGVISGSSVNPLRAATRGVATAVLSFTELESSQALAVLTPSPTWSPPTAPVFSKRRHFDVGFTAVPGPGSPVADGSVDPGTFFGLVEGRAVRASTWVVALVAREVAYTSSKEFFSRPSLFGLCLAAILLVVVQQVASWALAREVAKNHEDKVCALEELLIPKRAFVLLQVEPITMAVTGSTLLGPFPAEMEVSAFGAGSRVQDFVHPSVARSIKVFATDALAAFSGPRKPSGGARRNTADGGAINSRASKASLADPEAAAALSPLPRRPLLHTTVPGIEIAAVPLRNGSLLMSLFSSAPQQPSPATQPHLTHARSPRSPRSAAASLSDRVPGVPGVPLSVSPISHEVTAITSKHPTPASRKQSSESMHRAASAEDTAITASKRPAVLTRKQSSDSMRGFGGPPLTPVPSRFGVISQYMLDESPTAKAPSERNRSRSHSSAGRNDLLPRGPVHEALVLAVRIGAGGYAKVAHAFSERMARDMALYKAIAIIPASVLTSNLRIISNIPGLDMAIESENPPGPGHHATLLAQLASQVLSEHRGVIYSAGIAIGDLTIADGDAGVIHGVAIRGEAVDLAEELLQLEDEPAGAPGAAESDSRPLLEVTDSFAVPLWVSAKAAPLLSDSVFAKAPHPSGNFLVKGLSKKRRTAGSPAPKQNLIEKV